MKWYKYVFEDGYWEYSHGKMTALELRWAIHHHGRLMSLTLA